MRPSTSPRFAVIAGGAIGLFVATATGAQEPTTPSSANLAPVALYIAELSRISKIEGIEDSLDNPPKPTVIYDDLPNDEAHGWKFIAIGPDNKLYIPVGQPGNNVLHDAAHGQIRRINLDGSGAEVIALGVRNSVGFDWSPLTHQFYFTDNGRDWMSEDVPEDVPEDKLNRLSRVGEDFGVPYCYQGNIADPEFGWGHSCSDFTPPVALMGAHMQPSVCASTPAACSPRNIRTLFSSLDMAPGTEPTSWAATSSL